MGIAQTTFVVERCGGATESHVTGSDVTGSDAITGSMFCFPPRFFLSYYSSSTSTMATESDLRSRDPSEVPLGVRRRNRKLRNIHPVEWCAHA
jgi:hypothetical protein